MFKLLVEHLPCWTTDAFASFEFCQLKCQNFDVQYFYCFSHLDRALKYYGRDFSDTGYCPLWQWHIYRQQGQTEGIGYTGSSEITLKPLFYTQCTKPYYLLTTRQDQQTKRYKGSHGYTGPKKSIWSVVIFKAKAKPMRFWGPWKHKKK